MNPKLHMALLRTYNAVRHQRLGLPTAIGIELSTACNRRCSYCPQSLPDFRPKQNIVSSEVWDLFVRRLREFRWKGIVGFHRFGEPTLVPDFPGHVADVVSRVPGCLPMLFSNGDRPEVVRRALQAGLYRVILTQHENTKPDWLVQPTLRRDATKSSVRHPDPQHLQGVLRKSMNIAIGILTAVTIAVLFTALIFLPPDK